jgi:ferredoxin
MHRVGAVAELTVNMTACNARGLCAEVLPEVITLDDWGFPIITASVPGRLRDQAAEAVRLCPRLALHLAG